MTRQNSLDQAVISNAKDLDFIVLDELHTPADLHILSIAGWVPS